MKKYLTNIRICFWFFSVLFIISSENIFFDINVNVKVEISTEIKLNKINEGN